MPGPVRTLLVRAALAWAAVLALVNVLLNVLGGAGVFPLSPWHTSARVRALGLYALHRPTCALRGHPPLGPLVAAAERRHRLPPGLLAALVEVESGTEPHRMSGAGAVGAGQLLPSTARLLGVDDPFDPEDGLDGSARYLATQLHRFRDVRLAVAAYNAGPGAVDGRVPHNGETEFYVEQVLRAWGRRAPRPPPPPAAARTGPVAPARDGGLPPGGAVPARTTRASRDGGR